MLVVKLFPSASWKDTSMKETHFEGRKKEFHAFLVRKRMAGYFASERNKSMRHCEPRERLAKQGLGVSYP